MHSEKNQAALSGESISICKNTEMICKKVNHQLTKGDLALIVKIVINVYNRIKFLRILTVSSIGQKSQS